MIYLYLFGTCFHFIYVFMIIGNNVIRDFVAPNQLGWTTICLRDDGRNIHKQIPISHEMKPQYEISSFRELYKLVEMDL